MDTRLLGACDFPTDGDKLRLLAAASVAIISGRGIVATPRLLKNPIMSRLFFGSK